MRFRTTAVPQLLDTKSPSRGGATGPGRLTRVIAPLRRRLPLDRTLRKSAELRSEVSSGSEPLPAFGATIFDRCSSGSGTHAVTKSVTTLSAAHLWLICPFHGSPREVERGTQTDYGTESASAIQAQRRPGREPAACCREPSKFAKKRPKSRKVDQSVLVALGALKPGPSSGKLPY